MSDDYLNKIGHVEKARKRGETQVKRKVEEDQETDEEDRDRIETDQRRGQSKHSNDDREIDTSDSTRDQTCKTLHRKSQSFNGELAKGHSDYGGYTYETTVPSGTIEQPRRSMQQHLRYAARQEKNSRQEEMFNGNVARSEEVEISRESWNARNERCQQNGRTSNSNSEQYPTDARNKYECIKEYNEYDQCGNIVRTARYDPYAESIDDIGATSKEYYVQYSTDKNYENNQEQRRHFEQTNNKVYSENHINDDRNALNQDHYQWGNEYADRENQSSGKYKPHSCDTNEQIVRNANDRERCEPNTQNRRDECTHKTNDAQVYEYYNSLRDANYVNKCDSCANNQQDNSQMNHRKVSKEYTSPGYNRENGQKENPHHLQYYDREEHEYRNETSQSEANGSIWGERNHYYSSMNAMDRLYESKVRGSKQGKGGNKYGHKDILETQKSNPKVKRRSLENINSNFTKSLSEDTLTHWKGQGETRHTVHNVSINSNGEHSNENMDWNLRSETPERHYLDRYDFEQDEKILNHILEKSNYDRSQNKIPEIKVNDEMLEQYPVKDINSSTYNEIVDILKVLENEEKGLKTNQEKVEQTKNKACIQNESNSYQDTTHNDKLIKTNNKNVNKNNTSQCSTPTKHDMFDHQPQSAADHNETMTEAVHVGDIYSFLDQVDNQVMNGAIETNNIKSGNTSKLSELMKLSSADLAQKYLTLSINMDEKQIIITALEKRIEQIDKHCKEMKTDTDATVKRLQKFIAQLIREKKDLGEQCSDVCKEMEKKYKQIIETMEERHKIEIKKNTEKHLAAEKIRREKWIDTKTQKIKELTVKGLEPELLKMTNAHQEEIAEIRKAHNRQIEENDAMWNRKISTMKEKFEEDLQNAILQEKENSRKRLDEELKTVESNYQEQRKHLLNEIRIERENLDRQAEDMRNEKEKELNQKLEKMIKQNKDTCEKLESKHQDEIRKLREELNQEKQLWIETKTAQMEEKEQLIREQCRRERDKHIELIIQKLEKEQTERNTSAEMKLKNMKEQHDKDVEELETTLNSVKTKLNETRTKLQDTEDLVTELKSQLHTFQIENKNQSELLEKLKKENYDLKLKSEHETNDKINRLEEEIEQTRSYFETLISRMKKDQERELSQVYGRVKETIGKKDEAIALLTQQKQAALTQCANLEAILAQRKH